ncbi:unnamed protein product [Cylicocyclus nassatus]|uniref:Uncharacterized protein n=1 Tax=Cylicocyclus nassatus TaxID=53992 RepID=A0AA36GJZ0_CYLNA|nr:unnamed protein product [Cylicocyclus nassatus]
MNTNMYAKICDKGGVDDDIDERIFRRPGLVLNESERRIQSLLEVVKAQVLWTSAVFSRASCNHNAGSHVPAEYDAIARAPHLTASQDHRMHRMLQIDVFASKYSHLTKLGDIEETEDEDVPWTGEQPLNKLSKLKTTLTSGHAAGY